MSDRAGGSQCAESQPEVARRRVGMRRQRSDRRELPVAIGVGDQDIMEQLCFRLGSSREGHPEERGLAGVRGEKGAYAGTRHCLVLKRPTGRGVGEVE